MNAYGAGRTLHLNNQRAHCIDEYRIDDRLGQGNLTTAYRAWATDDSPVILTVLTVQEQVPFEPFVARFQQEAEAIQRLSHPHVLPLTDFGIHAGHPYLVTPDVKGITLASLLQTANGYSAEDALLIVEQVASALDYAHASGSLHRSLHPANIVVTKDHQVLVTGWGLAHMLEADDLLMVSPPSSMMSYTHLLSVAGRFLGNPAYVAPERVLGNPVTKEGDVYALGILLFEMLAGHPPFAGPDFLSVCLQPFSSPFPVLSELRADIPPTVDEVIRAATTCVPQMRFGQASDLVHAYQVALFTGHPRHLLETDVPLLPLKNEQEAASSPRQAHERDERGGNTSLIAPGVEKKHPHVVALSALQVAPWIEEDIFTTTQQSDLAANTWTPLERELSSRLIVEMENAKGVAPVESLEATSQEINHEGKISTWGQGSRQQLASISQPGKKKWLRKRNTHVKAPLAKRKSAPYEYQEAAREQCFPANPGTFLGRPETFAPHLGTFASCKEEMERKHPGGKVLPPAQGLQPVLL